MNTRDLTEFQLKQTRRSISNRTLGGQNETFITGTIDSTDTTFWIYDDGADFKSAYSHPTFEKPDYESLDALAEDFVSKILNTLDGTT